MMKMLKPENLQAFLDRHQIQGEIITLDVLTPTVEAAAQAVGAQTDQIVKTLVFIVQEQPIAAIACGTGRVDRRVIANRFGVGRKKVRLASADQVLQTTGYPAGAVPPFGHQSYIPCLLDPRVLEHAAVFAGGGAENALVRLNPLDIQRATQAEVVDLLNLHEKSDDNVP
jgi:Cys-tRNA(Pro) deacylase